MTKKHILKIRPKYFQAVVAQTKRFEIRKNDRNYQVGDWLDLLEWQDGGFTGNSCLREVKYISDYEQKRGFVVLGL